VTFHGAPGAATDLTPAQADPFLEMSPQELSSYSGDREAGALEHDPLHVAPGKVESSREPNTGQALAPQYVQLDAALRGDAPASKLSFLPVVRAPSARLLPMGRLALLAACLLLIVVLSLQVIVQQRDVIATVEPGAKPWLETLCTALGCEISPVLQIESVVIESSSFSRVRGDVYRLNFTLKNTAQLTIATPALELTLTDSQDQSMVRRVFNASDLGAKLDAMALGSELTGSLSISVTELNHPERISGYRLLAFYP
jgi:hypothetical protein